jgi:hypothetical protein
VIDVGDMAPDLDPAPGRLGEPPRPGLRRRRDGLLEVRRQDEDPRGRDRPRGDRRAPPRRPRAAATLSWAVGVVRLSAREGVAVGFARPAADAPSREPARAVRWLTIAARAADEHGVRPRRCWRAECAPSLRELLAAVGYPARSSNSQVESLKRGVFKSLSSSAFGRAC